LFHPQKDVPVVVFSVSTKIYLLGCELRYNRNFITEGRFKIKTWRGWELTSSISDIFADE